MATSCLTIERIAKKHLPDAKEASGLDAGICAMMVLIFLIAQVSFAHWAYHSMRNSALRRTQKIRAGLANALSASAAFFFAIALPSHWVRSAILKRNFAAVEYAANECKAKDVAAECASQCLAVKQKSVPVLPPDIAVRATGFALAAAFLLASCTVTLHASSGTMVTTTASSMGQNRGEERKKRRYALKMLSEDDVTMDDEHCVVCLGALSEMRACELQCSHRFHKRCIEKWLRKANQPRCPLCQMVVPRVEYDDEP